MSSTPQQLAAKMIEKTDSQLLDMFPNANEWTAEALHAARAELQSRNIPVPEAAPPPPNLDWEITARGRKRYLRATTFDKLISLVFPGWGLLVGLIAGLKGERKRAITMIIIGLIPISIGICQRVRIELLPGDPKEETGWILISK